MIKTFFGHLLESLKSLKRNGWMTIASISSVMITLIGVGIFSSVILNTAKIATDIEKNVRVLVYLRPDTADNSKTIVHEGKTISNKDYKKIYHQLIKVDHIKRVTFSSKEEQLKQLTNVMGKDWEIFRGDANPLYDAYIVDTTDPKFVNVTAKTAKKINGVTEVEYGGIKTERLFKIANFIRLWGLIGVGLLVFIAVFLISNTIRITIISRSREIQIMRLVGAKNSYIRGPFLLEGAFIGLLGALPPAALLYLLYRIAFQSFNPYLLPQNISMIPPGVFTLVMTVLLFVMGIIIGSIGSAISMRRFLKI